MTITEFAESRNVEAQAVSRYLVRHPKEKASCRKIGKTVELSEEAFVLLDKQYPMPKPVQVINGVPHEEYEAVQKKLDQTRELLIAMKDVVAEKEKLLIQQEANVKLLEDKSAFIEKALEEEKAEKASIQAKNEALYEEINRLNAELIEAKRPKSLIERIFKKKAAE
jgi:hypothetical protein